VEIAIEASERQEKQHGEHHRRKEKEDGLQSL
jgi:hypothetical protein